MTEVYLDYNGSSPLDRRVAEVMVPVLTDHVGNASAIHRFGRRQAALVDDAREQVAASGRRPSVPVWCSPRGQPRRTAWRCAGGWRGRPPVARGSSCQLWSMRRSIRALVGSTGRVSPRWMSSR